MTNPAGETACRRHARERSRRSPGKRLSSLKPSSGPQIPFSAWLQLPETKINAAPRTDRVTEADLALAQPDRSPRLVDHLPEDEDSLLGGNARRQTSRLPPQQPPGGHRQQVIDAVPEHLGIEMNRVLAELETISTPSFSGSQRQANHSATNAFRLQSSSLVAAP